MTTIYLVRHGETEANLNLIYQGCINTPLTENGLKQVERLVEKLAPVKFDCIYSSPLPRALYTAEAIGKGRNIPLVVDPVLIEVGGGLFEGKTMQELKQSHPEETRIWFEEFWRFLGPGLDEGVETKFEQMKRAITRMVRQHPNQTVALSAHGCVQRVFNGIIQGWPIERLQELTFGPNCCFSAAEFEEDGTVRRILTINERSHLQGFEVHHFGTD